jgi:hypothetical protein
VLGLNRSGKKRLGNQTGSVQHRFSASSIDLDQNWLAGFC